MRLRRGRFFRILIVSIIIMMIVGLGYYFLQSIYPYLYDVAHGELPCFANKSTHDNLHHMFFAFHRLMSMANLTYWLDCGSLLGSVRYQGVIPYDHNGDLGYLLKDLQTISKLIVPGLKIEYEVVLDKHKPVQMRHQGATVDLFAMGTDQEIGLKLPLGKNANTLTRAFYRVSDYFEQIYADSNMDDILPTKLCHFENGWLMCPNKPNSVLSTRYPSTGCP